MVAAKRAAKRSPPKRRPPKTPPKTPQTPAVTGAVMESNGGLLLVGNPGNAGGTGRPPSLIRERCRGSFEQRIPILEQIADGLLQRTIATLAGPVVETPSIQDRTRAIDLLGKYGGIEKVAIEASSGPAETLSTVGDEELLKVLMVRAERLQQVRSREKSLRHG